MSCVHLKKLYQLCQENQLRLSSSDLIHIVCTQCEKEEVCPSILSEVYEAKELDDDGRENGPDTGRR
ncbi:hypothetical protein [Lignipirellula cremea]|uniref:Uncharacterized protein n=1 Tax=Lignipirellula cremea TaxID=2528010 RepID=A0A518DLM7_9BACT|nr:hypothetical protein [Lignipirellula cremea]QDU92748.1 hypothetical protein Pla8534_04970 [Lignipirellula cremea]